METVRENVRQCSVPLRRCDLDSRRSAPRAEGGVPDSSRELGAPVPSSASDHIQEHFVMPAMVIKKERNGEEATTTPEAGAECICPPESMATDFGVLIKEEDSFIMKTEHKADEVRIKQELDIGPTVVQPLAAPRMHSPATQAGPHPRPGTSSGGGGAPAPLCMVYAPPKLRTEAADNPEKSRVPPSVISIKLESKTAEDCYLGILKGHSYDRTGSENSSMDKQVGGRRRCSVRSSSEHYSERAKTGPRTGGKQYECHYCKYITKKKCHLIDHMCKHTGEKLHKCEQCEYCTSRLGSLKTHMRTHTGEKPYKCEQCEYRAAQLVNLKIHIRRHTGEKPYKCDRCEYSASHVSYLKSHMRTHTGEKPYRCKQCAYTTSRLSALKIHICTHTGEKPYKCKHCAYSTYRLSALKVHIRTHTGEKPYKCEQCEYSTYNSSNLKVHMCTHTGAKPYKCEQCDYSASHLSVLKRHKRIHTGEKPYKCEQCAYSASVQGNLNRHMRTHTGYEHHKRKQC